MTEQVYIDFILKKAQAYLVEIRKDPGDRMEMKAVSEWEHAKSMLSAHTIFRLCEHWKATGADTADEASEGTSIPKNTTPPA